MAMGNSKRGYYGVVDKYDNYFEKYNILPEHISSVKEWFCL